MNQFVARHRPLDDTDCKSCFFISFYYTASWWWQFIVCIINFGYFMLVDQPRRFADGTTITLKCLDLFISTIILCSNYNIVYILWEWRNTSVWWRSPVFINFIWIIVYDINLLIFFLFNFLLFKKYFIALHIYIYLYSKPVIKYWWQLINILNPNNSIYFIFLYPLNRFLQRWCRKLRYFEYIYYDYRNSHSLYTG